jgi:fucose permease
MIAFVPVIFALLATAYPALPPSGFNVGQAFGLLGKAAVLVAALALFCYVGLEASMGGWITTYLTSVGQSAAAANGVLSGFWIAIMASRLLTGITQMINPANGAFAIMILALVATITILIMVATKNKGLAAFAVLITGLAFGPIFPTIVGVTFDKVNQPELNGSVFAIIFAVGLLGASTIPAAIGIYSRGKSIQKSLVIAAMAALVLTLIALAMGRV